MKKLLLLLLVLCGMPLYSQEIDADLLRVKEKLEKVKAFTAKLNLELEVPFINMPPKQAQMHFEEGKETEFNSSDFVFLPKRGLDFSLSELFKYPFITVNRGMDTLNGEKLKVVNLIPTADDAPIVLATLSIDLLAERIMVSQITTKKQGSYTLKAQYEDENAIMPNYVEVSFAIERLKIPLNFMGRNTDIDRKKMRQMDTKTGKIKMKIDYTNIVLK